MGLFKFLAKSSNKTVNKIPGESALIYNNRVFKKFYADFKSGKLPYIPNPTKEELQKYKELTVIIEQENQMIASNNSIPPEVHFWVDKVSACYFDQLMPMLGSCHWVWGAEKELYKYKGYVWYSPSECYPGTMFD